LAFKYDKNLAGILVTDELHNSLGAGNYNLIHDTFFGGTYFDIYTAAASGGTHLIENTHYTLHDEDTDLTTEAGRTVFTAVKIIDPTYQACDLYFTYNTIGDYNEAADVNILRDILAKDDDYTIDDLDRNPAILMTTGAADKTATLPTVADNIGKFITLKKADAGIGDAILDGEGAETIDGAASVTLPERYDEITVISDGVSWYKIGGNRHRLITRHVRLAAPSWKIGVAGPAPGYVGIVPVLLFDKTADDSVHYSVIVPYKLQAGSAISVVVDWCYTGGADVGTVCWALEYINLAAGDAVAGGTTTILGTSPGTHASGVMVRTSLITGITGAIAHDVIGLRLYRDISGDTLDTDADMIEVHFEFIEDKLGKPI